MANPCDTHHVSNISLDLCSINLDNKKSIRLVKAIGMQKEGIKKRYWYENEKWVDHIIYVANPEDIGLNGKKPVIR